jgi:hypothetical protein
VIGRGGGKSQGYRDGNQVAHIYSSPDNCLQARRTLNAQSHSKSYVNDFVKGCLAYFKKG